jgi:type II secretory pathway pseudopilin PulG
VEVLAALVLMAIVIPVAVSGMHVASLAGEVTQRKSLAMQIAERLLNEVVVTKQWSQAFQSGVEQAGPYTFRWAMHDEPWTQLTTLSQAYNTVNGINTSVVNGNTIHQLSVDVSFTAQGKTYSVHLATITDTSQQSTMNGTIPQQ